MSTEPEPRRLRRALTRILVDSPLSRTGALVATGVGLAIGVPLSTGRVKVVNGLIVCQGLPPWAFGRGGSCIGHVYLTDRNISDRVLRHERKHVDQWLTYGLLFPLLYFASGRDPFHNRFEIEAGLADGGYHRERAV